LTWFAGVYDDRVVVQSVGGPVAATCEDGVLRVTLPKRESAREEPSASGERRAASGVLG